MLLLYNVSIVLLTLILLPLFLYRGFVRDKYRLGLRQRLAMYPRDVLDKISGKPVIWIQAVSVGEVLAARPLILEIRERFREHQLLVSTTTLTGHRIYLEKVARDDDIVIFFPLDFYWTVRRALRIFKPSMIALVETEIWPNFICAANSLGIPVVLLNGRISDHSFKGYMRFRSFVKRAVGSFAWLGMQTEKDAERIIAIGADPAKVSVTPSLKYEGALELADRYYDKAAIRSELRLPGNARLLTAGSTHNGEEEALTEVYLKLKQEFPRLVLLLAPRHPQRVPRIEAYLQSRNIDYVLRSRLLDENAPSAPVIVLDTLGELVKYYSISTVVFIGKSMFERGGQNPIEPAAFSKPVIFGPYMDNFREVAELLVEKKGACVVRGPEELAKEVRRLLLDPDGAKKMGARARKAVISKKGAVERTIEFTNRLLTPKK